MFEKREPFNWKPPILVLVGVAVLSSGIYLGVKTRDTGAKEVNATKKEQQSIDEIEETKKEVFQLSEDCEIWVHKKKEDGTDSGKAPMMIGTIDKALFNKSENEIREYLKDKYPERNVESLSKYEIILTEVVPTTDQTRTNKYSLEPDNEFIGLYRYDSEGKRELVEKTEIKIGSLPKKVQDEIKKGIIVNSEDEAYTKLEEFGS